jgi:hypothetical protein
MFLLYVFERGPESKIGRGDHASTGAGNKISKTKCGQY